MPEVGRHWLLEQRRRKIAEAEAGLILVLVVLLVLLVLLVPFVLLVL